MRFALTRVQLSSNQTQIEALDILVDYDDNGYLLQIFTKVL